MSGDKPAAKRARLSDNDVRTMTKDQLEKEIQEMRSYIEFVEEKQRITESENEELKSKLIVARRKENTIVTRLTYKEQEILKYSNSLQKIKLETSQMSSSGQLRTMHLDPAINLIFLAMQKEIDKLKAKVEESQNELTAWKFTPDSQTGKKLMSKCKLLHQENEELGKQLSSGRISNLEGQIVLERSIVKEMKKSQSELDEFLGEIDEDVEGMQGMVYQLQQQLKDTKQQLEAAQERLSQLEPPPTNDVEMNDVGDLQSLKSDLEISNVTENHVTCLVKQNAVQIKTEADFEDSEMKPSVTNCDRISRNTSSMVTGNHRTEHSPVTLVQTNETNNGEFPSTDHQSQTKKDPLTSDSSDTNAPTKYTVSAPSVVLPLTATWKTASSKS